VHGPLDSPVERRSKRKLQALPSSTLVGLQLLFLFTLCCWAMDDMVIIVGDVVENTVVEQAEDIGDGRRR